MFVAYGAFRASAESAWTTDNADPPIWTAVGSCSGTPDDHCFHGYLASGSGKDWGTNNIVTDSILDGTGAITTAIDHHTLFNLVSYDQGSSNPFEAQVVGGDSGSAVFHKNGSQWELAGITVANSIYENQESIQFNQAALYGNASAFADLSAYSSAIASIQAAHQDYSIVGDLNMDGVVDAGDLNTFVANWGYNNATGQGSITSWKHGDLTHDGKVDVNDFFRWRNDVGIASASSLETMLGSSLSNSIPEPATISLLSIPSLCWISAATTHSRENVKTSGVLLNQIPLSIPNFWPRLTHFPPKSQVAKNRCRTHFRDLLGSPSLNDRCPCSCWKTSRRCGAVTCQSHAYVRHVPHAQPSSAALHQAIGQQAPRPAVGFKIERANSKRPPTIGDAAGRTIVGHTQTARSIHNPVGPSFF